MCLYSVPFDPCSDKPLLVVEWCIRPFSPPKKPLHLIVSIAHTFLLLRYFPPVRIPNTRRRLYVCLMEQKCHDLYGFYFIIHEPPARSAPYLDSRLPYLLLLQGGERKQPSWVTSLRNERSLHTSVSGAICSQLMFMRYRNVCWNTASVNLHVL